MKSKIKNQKYNVKFKILHFGLSFCILIFGFWIYPSFAQQSDELEFSLDVASSTVPLPKIFQANIDLSGRGFHRDQSWPQGLAAKEVLDIWQEDIGFSGVYRIQYNLWEINQLAKDKELQAQLLANYENIIKRISDAGGLVILDLFGTPAGLGKVLDKRSAPWDLKAFKELVKGYIKNLSCEKRYNIWYEVWSAPDLDDFFLGRKQEYLNLYRVVAEAINELEKETKVYIPIGGPGSSWWFQNFDGNTIIAAERSLIYELIKFSYQYHLHLDFISWHDYSTDPQTEKEITTYNKPACVLIRDWLSYFHFDRNTPLMVTEWNYDTNANVLPERLAKANIAASFIPARLKQMYNAGIDRQLYFSLEDFQNNKEGVVRNIGAFSFDPEASEYKGSAKVIYNAFRMLGMLEKEFFVSAPKLKDEFAGAIATKNKKDIALLFYNYIDPEIARNYLSRNISSLNASERRALLNLIKSGKLEKILHEGLEINSLKATSKLKATLKKAKDLNEQAGKFREAGRNLKISLKNLKEDYIYQRYVLDSSCVLDCKFSPGEEKNIPASLVYEDTLKLEPYSLSLVILKPKPPQLQPQPQPEIKPAAAKDESQTQAIDQLKVKP